MNSPYEIALHSQRRIDIQALRVLYDLIGWWPERELPAIAEVLDQNLAIAVWDGELLIAFARVVSDGHFRAYIEDVCVHPDYRHQGVAAAMLTMLLDQIKHIDIISLFCSAELVGLYEQSGFRARRSQVVMHH